MSNDKASVISDERAHLLDDLQGLLEKQIELVRKSDFRSVELLAEQARSIVNKIVETEAFEQPYFGGRREHLTKLYRRLELMFAAEKERLGQQLRRIDEVKRTLRAYHGNG